MVNALKRYVKYYSEKLSFYKLRNKFFDRVRNRGLRKYGLSKLFSLVSYSDRHKYLLTSDNIYSNVIQETQADKALTEVAEEIFREHITTKSQDPNLEKQELRGTNKDGTTTPTDKVVPFGKLNDQQISFSRKNFSLGFVFPGECYELKKDIEQIFDEEFKRACHKSTTFKQCFKGDRISPIFKNEKKLGALISKSKL